MAVTASVEIESIKTGLKTLIVERLKLERSSNIHSVDVVIGGSDTMYLSFYGEKLIAPGEEGIHSVELANVILYSSLIDDTVQMPMDSAAYEKKLNQLIAESKLEKKVVEIVNEDFTKSFNR